MEEDRTICDGYCEYLAWKWEEERKREKQRRVGLLIMLMGAVVGFFIPELLSLFY